MGNISPMAIECLSTRKMMLIRTNRNNELGRWTFENENEEKERKERRKSLHRRRSSAQEKNEEKKRKKLVFSIWSSEAKGKIN